MPYGLVQVIIDDSTDKVVTGTIEYDRDNGGTLKIPSGTSFPGTPSAGEVFWRTDENKLYRRNDLNTAWDLVEAVTDVPITVTTPIRNETGVMLLKHRLVAPVGYNIVEGRPLVNYADKDNGALRPAIAMLTENVNNNTNSSAIVVGSIFDIDTTIWALTDQLVLGNDGYLSRPPPDEDPFTGEIQNIGSVIRVHASNGEVVVSIDGLTPVTAAQIFALGGTAGIPSSTNKYVTDSDARMTDARTPTAHATTHTDGTDDVQNATAGQKGLATATQITKLDGVEALADVTDVTNVEAAGAVMETLVDVRGDLIVASAADTVMRVAVGTNDHVLTADSAEASGVKWAVGGGGGDTVKVSSDDTTAGYVEDKIVGTTDKIALSTNNPGGNETRQITTGADIIDRAVSAQITSITEKTILVEDDEVMVEDSENSDVKKSAKLKNFPFPAGHIDGFVVTRVSDTTVQIAAGECRDTTDEYNIVSTGTVNVAITTSGANGLDTGLEASDTPYHVIICVGSSGVCGLLSVSLSPTLPTGYNWGYRHVGATINNSSSDFMAMLHKGTGKVRRYQINEDRNDVAVLISGSATSWTTVDVSDFCPKTAAFIDLMIFGESTVNGDFTYFRPYNFTNAIYGTRFVTCYIEGSTSFELVNVGEQFEYLSRTSTCDVNVYMVGFTLEV